MVQRHVRILRRPQTGHRLPPQAGRREHVGLVHARHAAFALARGFESQSGNALDLGDRVGHLVARALAVRRGFMRAEVDSADEFAHDEHVDARRNDIRLQRARPLERVPHLGRTQIAEEPELLAQRQKRPLLRALRTGQRVPLRTAHGAEQHGVRGFARRKRRVRQAVPAQIVRRAADRIGRQAEIVPELPGDGVQNLHRLAHNLRTDSVAGDDRNRLLHFLPFR